jgi:hypothetical protein
MLKLKAGYPKATVALKTASGEASAVRALDPKDATVVEDNGKETLVTQAVVNYVLHSTAEKTAKQDKEAAAEIVRTYVGQVRTENALAGSYQKSLRVMGKIVKDTQYSVDAAHQDKFTVPKVKEDIDAIKAALGPAFDTIFESVTEISIKKNVMENDKLRKELSQLLLTTLGADGIKKYFEKTETYGVKTGMAADMYTLDKKVREAFLSRVKQAADALKDSSSVVSSTAS